MAYSISAERERERRKWSVFSLYILKKNNKNNNNHAGAIERERGLKRGSNGLIVVIIIDNRNQ
jgi:hypothetical protein